MNPLFRRPRLMAMALPAMLLLAFYAHAVASVVHQGQTASTKAPEGLPLVVLGKRIGSEGMDEDFRARLERTQAVLKQWPELPLVLSGGFPGEGGTEAAQAAAFLGAQRVGWQLEERATNTFENLAFSRSLIEPGVGLAVVSNRYHLARVQAIAHRQGVDVSLVAAEDEWSWSMTTVGAVLVEGLWVSGIALGLGPRETSP